MRELLSLASARRPFSTRGNHLDAVSVFRDFSSAPVFLCPRCVDARQIRVEALAIAGGERYFQT